MNNLEEIRSCHGRLVWSTVYRILRDHAESLDCYQDVFCELLDPARRQKVENWPAYLRWLATRRAIDRLRTRQRRQSRLDSNDTALVQSSAPGPSETAQFNELAERVRQELTKLPQRQAEAFWLACIEEMTYEEVGRQLGIDASTVGGLIHRARRRLREAFTAVKAAEPSGGGHRHG
jgi:RNA polymerase sigma-70 factor (ECF subfamily)